MLERIPSTSVTVALIPSPLDRIPSCSFTLKVSICFKDVRLYIFSQQLWRMVQPISVCMFEMVHTVLLSLVEMSPCNSLNLPSHFSCVKTALLHP